MFAFPCDLPPFWWLLPITLGTLAALLGRLARPISLPAIERELDSRWAPVGAGLLTALLGFLVWGSLDQPGIYHDEIAYRLQAEIVASRRLAGEPAPLPEFFEQYHVLVSPSVCHSPDYAPLKAGRTSNDLRCRSTTAQPGPRRRPRAVNVRVPL